MRDSPSGRKARSPDGVEKNKEKESIPKAFLGAPGMAKWVVRKATMNGKQGHALRRVEKESPQSSRIAGFDLDGTLISRPSKAHAAISEHDFHVEDHVKHSLQRLNDEGYRVVIFSNQSSIGKNVDGKAGTKMKALVDNVAQHLNIPLEAYVAHIKWHNKQLGSEDPCRKPQTGKGAPSLVALHPVALHLALHPRNVATGMWEMMERSVGDEVGVEVDKASSFFVGDAAGRDKDHDDCDRQALRAIAMRLPSGDELTALLVAFALALLPFCKGRQRVCEEHRCQVLCARGILRQGAQEAEATRRGSGRGFFGAQRGREVTCFP